MYLSAGSDGGYWYGEAGAVLELRRNHHSSQRSHPTTGPNDTAGSNHPRSHPSSHARTRRRSDGTGLLLLAPLRGMHPTGKHVVSSQPTKLRGFLLRKVAERRPPAHQPPRIVPHDAPPTHERTGAVGPHDARAGLLFDQLQNVSSRRGDVLLGERGELHRSVREVLVADGSDRGMRGAVGFVRGGRRLLRTGDVRRRWRVSRRWMELHSLSDDTSSRVHADDAGTRTNVEPQRRTDGGKEDRVARRTNIEP